MNWRQQYVGFGFFLESYMFPLIAVLTLSCPALRAESLFDCPLEVDVTLHSAEFLGPLQYRTWRKMSSIFQPGNRKKPPDHTVSDRGLKNTQNRLC